MEIPSKFKIANQEIKVILEDSLPNNDYGYYCDATNEIHIAKTVETEIQGVINLTQNQLLNTFYHELFHVFQFYFNNEFSEAQAQVYANFMCEFIESSENNFKNNKNEII